MLETLVVVGIIAILLAIVAPTFRTVRSQMKSLMCASNMKTVAFKFHMFADGLNREGRGHSAALGPKQFWIDDFQANLYGVGEFQPPGSKERVQISPGDSVMVCPAGPGPITLHRSQPFGPLSVRPMENVTLAMNQRLSQAVRRDAATGKYVLAKRESTRVPSNILRHPYVPLVFDVDGVEAKERGISPFYSAPPGRNPDDPYASEWYWMPSLRHGGVVNVAFVGGHVLSSRRPAGEPWDWDYQATVRR